MIILPIAPPPPVDPPPPGPPPPPPPPPSTDKAATRVLQALRDALAQVPGVVTCKVGIEANMTPADYPMIRIVPTRMQYSSVISRRRIDVTVYFGKPTHEFTDGLQELYWALFDLEAEIISYALQASPVFVCLYVDTIADEDRVDGFKLMAVRLTVEG